jgi:hypothetical protein
MQALLRVRCANAGGPKKQLFNICSHAHDCRPDHLLSLKLGQPTTTCAYAYLSSGLSRCCCHDGHIGLPRRSDASKARDRAMS